MVELSILFTLEAGQNFVTLITLRNAHFIVGFLPASAGKSRLDRDAASLVVLVVTL